MRITLRFSILKLQEAFTNLKRFHELSDVLEECFSEVKVYGERNSGTNFVEQMILRTFDIEIIWNIPDIPQERRRDIENSGLPTVSANCLVERIWDEIYYDYRLQHRGWKHEKLSDDRLADYEAAAAGKCGFVFVVRNPFDWSRSMQRNPFHVQQHVSQDFSEFIRSPWMLLKRDCIDKDYLATPVLLWKIKVAEYIRLASEGRGLLVRYEDVLQKPDSVLAAFNTFFGADKSELTFPIKSARSFVSDTRTFTSFQSENTLEMARQKINYKDALFIEDIVGCDLLLQIYPELESKESCIGW